VDRLGERLPLAEPLAAGELASKGRGLSPHSTKIVSAFPLKFEEPSKVDGELAQGSPEVAALV
jgi:hypothetical protein